MTGSQNEVGESPNLDVASYLLKLGSTMYFGTLKFIYSEKATKFCEIFTSLLSYVVQVKCKAKFSQNFVAFSEYMNFNIRQVVSQ